MKTKQNPKQPAADWMTHLAALRHTLSSLDPEARASAKQFAIRQLLLSLANEDTNESRRAFFNATTLGCFELQTRLLEDPKYGEFLRPRASVPALFPAGRKDREALAQLLRKAGLGTETLFKETLKKRRSRPEVEKAKAFALLADLAREHSADHVATGTGIHLSALLPLQKLPPQASKTLVKWQDAFWAFSCALADGDQNLIRLAEWADMPKARMDPKTRTTTVPPSVLRQAFDRALAQVLRVSGK